MEHVFIINPVAGRADARSFLLPQLEKAKRALGLAAQVECTTRPARPKTLRAAGRRRGAPVRLYACGGDGHAERGVCGALGFTNAQVASVPLRVWQRFYPHLRPKQPVSGYCRPDERARCAH